MPEDTKHGNLNPGQGGRGTPIECPEFDALLNDALEGQLSGARKESFDAHRRICAVCGPLFADAEAGRQWLRSLEPVEPPVHLVHNILAATSGVMSTRIAATAPGGPTTPLGERLREWWDSWFTPFTGFVRQPRFVMSFGMIFFSFSLALNAAGVKPADVAKIDLRPTAIRHAYNDAQIKVVKYYDNIRFVYEIESRVRELKRENPPAEPSPPEKKQNRNNNDTSGQPNQKQDRNYTEQQADMVLASLDARTAQPELATSCKLRAQSELGGARTSNLEADGRLSIEARCEQPPVPLTTTLTTTDRRFV